MAEVFYLLTITVPFMGPVILKYLPEIFLSLVVIIVGLSLLKGRDLGRIRIAFIIILTVYIFFRGDYWISYVHSRILCIANARVEVLKTVKIEKNPAIERSYSGRFRMKYREYYEIEGEKYMFKVERFGVNGAIRSQIYRISFVSERLDETMATIKTFAPIRGWFDKVFGYENGMGPRFCEGRVLWDYGRGNYGEPDLIRLVFKKI
jgi:hypothetical protein